MRQPGLLIESVERQLLDELESVNQDVVALRTELYALHFLAPHYRPHIGLADAHYPILNTLARSVVLEVLPLLAVHPREDFHITLLPGCQQFLRTCILPLQHACLLQYLPRKLSRRLASFLVWTFVCLRCFQYDRLTFSTSTYFVLGR